MIVVVTVYLYLDILIPYVKNISFFHVQYKAQDVVVKGSGKFEIVFTPSDGGEKTTVDVFDFEGLS